MTGSVIQRNGTNIVDQRIIHDDQPVEWVDADTRAGFRLDRRKLWAFIKGELHEVCRWTQPCTGCACDCGDGYPCGHGAAGCDECGYSGRVRQGMWVPFFPKDNES